MVFSVLWINELMCIFIYLNIQTREFSIKYSNIKHFKL